MTKVADMKSQEKNCYNFEAKLCSLHREVGAVTLLPFSKRQNWRQHQKNLPV